MMAQHGACLKRHPRQSSLQLVTLYRMPAVSHCQPSLSLDKLQTVEEQLYVSRRRGL